jgi:hypothetical protein
MDNEACQFCGAAAHTKMCIISDKLYRFCCQEARSRPPVTLLNLPPCVDEDDTDEDEDNDSDTQSTSDSETESDDDV